MSELSIQVTGRALVVIDNKLLLVSNTGDYWYTPGGRLTPNESLPQCISREVYEETGLEVQVGNLIHVAEYIEQNQARHKIECYFLATPSGDRLPANWADLDGPVEHFRLFTLDEMRGMRVLPVFLTEGTWLAESPGGMYRGLE